MVISDFFWVVGEISLMCLSALTKTQTFIFDGRVIISDAEKNKIERSYCLITAPVVLCLIVKAYTGHAWMFRKDRNRSSLQTYYVTSWSFYSSFCIMQAFLLWATRHYISNLLLFGSLGLILACWLSWIILFFHMRFKDNQHYLMTSIRRETAQSKSREIE
jgi:hypothetical protein